MKHFGKKIQHWRSEGGYRRHSESENTDDGEQFRGRSKSLDCNFKKRITDHDAYRIYDNILKEGKFEKRYIYFLLDFSVDN